MFVTIQPAVCLELIKRTYDHESPEHNNLTWLLYFILTVFIILFICNLIQHRSPDLLDSYECVLSYILLNSVKLMNLLLLQDKQLLCRIASWAVPVAIQAPVKLGQRQSTGGYAESKKLPERLPEKLTRWLTASLVLGKLAPFRNKLGSTKSLADTHPTCLNILYGSQSIQTADFHPANIELAIQLLQLQVHIVGESYNPLVTALASLWPFYKPEETLPGLFFYYHF